MGKTGMNPALLEGTGCWVCAPFHAGEEKKGAMQRLVGISTGDHPKETTQLQACLPGGAGVIEEGAEVDLS